MYAIKSSNNFKLIINRSNILHSRKLYGQNFNNVIRRKYESILRPSQPPSALNYQLYKLSTPRSGILTSLWSNALMNRFNVWSLRHPLTLAALIATSKNSFCDWLAQCQIEKRNRHNFNYQRLLLFALFGFFYCGFVQYGIYSKLYPFLFGKIKNVTTYTVVNTFTDLVFHSTMLYFPVFYIFKGAVYEQTLNMNVIQDALHKYFKVNFKDDMIALYKVWLPSLAVMFAIIPVQYRVPFLSSIGCLWAVFLSVMRGDKEKIVQIKSSKITKLNINKQVQTM